ncbi:ribosome biogenesis GTPase [Oryzisolibacter propanilivorax]|uniref:Small ribosomal subunit biogenesis GTPase RsgA n=1 Tax=Oryzisolibacter propanilivorax TaxID=1527607 RepID=A0A1G9TM96_9BURK|nr:ribosome small subunit-dependent GTPase A [Oryzisolibacter propanilivorax]SDM48896.1 ribosome biogenesis GTPase [Oryzisolibacter propanilivorax]
MNAEHEGLVVASHGRHCVVETADGERRICHPRGKKSQAVVGDRVRWRAAAPGQGDEGTIEQVLARRNLFYRQDEVRTKSFAANLDQVLVLIAAEPVFSESQLVRALIACEAAHIPALIALNKSDLVEPFARAWERLWPYRHMGGDGQAAHHYGVLPLSLTQSGDVDREALLPLLQGKTTLVLGPSGAGKSTLVNLLVPQAKAQTGEISQALNSGRHTTTSTQLYWIDDERRTALIDSPGFQEFGLRHLVPSDLARCMPDIAAHAGECRFYNCTHLHEPGCAVLAHVGSDARTPGAISAQRHRIYGELFDELSQSRY